MGSYNNAKKSNSREWSGKQGSLGSSEANWPTQARQLHQDIMTSADIVIRGIGVMSFRNTGLSEEGKGN